MIEILKDEQYRGSLLTGFRAAQKEILIMTYKCDYHATLASRSLNPLVQELRRARARDVKVWIILNWGGPHSSIGASNMRASHRLAKGGVEVHRSPTGRTFHAKLVVIDGKYIWIGSHNLSETSLGRNFELSVMITDTEIAQKFRKTFLDVWYR